MQALLALARGIDALNARIARVVFWLVLVVTLISAGNAIIRKMFDMSSNAWLEAQWYLFSAIFLLCAPYTLMRNDMVRIDVIAGRLTKRAQAIIDILGTLFFLLPVVGVIGLLSWPVFINAYTLGEMSSNAGGLTVWPARLLLPVGMALLALQGVSQLLKQVGYLQGLCPDPNDKSQEKTAEQLLAEEIARQRGDVTGVVGGKP
jgi:TRAP-type mannitol/chloroaromatic compound transport system permease small subunit